MPMSHEELGKAMTWGGAAAIPATAALQGYFGGRAFNNARTEKALTPEQLTGLDKALGAENVPRLILQKEQLDKLDPELAAAVPTAYASDLHPEDLDNIAKELKLKFDPKFRDQALRDGFVIARHDQISPSILSHELGHATGAKPGRFGQFMYQWGAPLGMLGSLGVGAATADPRQSAGKYLLRAALKGLGIGAVIGVPQLYEEYRATDRGLTGLQEVGVEGEEYGKAKKSLRNAYYTYLLNNSLPAIGAAVAGAGIRRMHAY